MPFTIGIGVLFEEDANNELRQLELLLAEKTKNWSGLGQPPHITVKVPFEVRTIKDVNMAARVMSELAKDTQSLDIRLLGFGNFGDKVVYAAVSNTSELSILNNQLLEKFTEPGEAREYERGQMIFHSTLAMNLSKKQYLAGQELLQPRQLDIKTRATSLGLFLGIDNLQHWVVISQAPLRIF